MTVWLLVLQIIAADGSTGVAVFPTADIESCRDIGTEMVATVDGAQSFECRPAKAEAGHES